MIGGLGPTFVFNSATDDRLGLGKWSVGPTIAVVSIPDPWVVGAVFRNIWSFAGDHQRQKVNAFLVQPFLNYNFRNGWYLASTPVISANWEAEDKRNRWTVPIGGGIGKSDVPWRKTAHQYQTPGILLPGKTGFGPRLVDTATISNSVS